MCSAWPAARPRTALGCLPRRWGWPRRSGARGGLLAAVVASLISSRVRTFNAAQQLGGLVLMPVWGRRLRPGGQLQDWGPLALFGAVAGLLLVDGAATALAAATWRREEVLAQR